MNALERAPFIGFRERHAPQANKFGLVSCDHFGLPCKDPHLAGKFVEQILGGVEIYRAGYSEEDRKRGRLRHIFYHVGSLLVEVVEQDDGVSYPDVTNPGGKNTNPHWAFQTTAVGLANFVEHLKREGIPFDGPRTHVGASVVSVYFRDIDNNNLEVTTWEELPEGLVETIPMGGKYGHTVWNELSHSWRPR